MSSGFVFDPDRPQALVDEWMAQVGLLHRNTRYNGWMLFDSDRVLLDVYLPDINGEWVDMTTTITSTYSGWDALADRAIEAGATDIIGVHAHTADEPLGPCGELPMFAASGAAAMSKAGLNLRAVFVLNNDKLDGIAFLEDAIESEMPMAAAAQPFDTSLMSFEETIANIRTWAETGDPVAVRLVPLLDEIERDVAAGRRPDPLTLAKATMLCFEGLGMLDDVVPPTRERSVLDLPMLDLNNKNKGYLN